MPGRYLLDLGNMSWVFFGFSCHGFMCFCPGLSSQVIFRIVNYLGLGWHNLGLIRSTVIKVKTSFVFGNFSHHISQHQYRAGVLLGVQAMGEE